MPNIRINNIDLLYTIKHSNRRQTICLKALSPEKIEIILPAGIRNFNIEKFLYSKFNWIQAKVNNLRTLAETPVNKDINNGNLILYCGETYELQIMYHQASESKIKLNNKTIAVHLPQNTSVSSINHKCASILEHWYKTNAEKILIQKTQYWSSKLGTCPKKINIKDQKTRWGSCSSLGNINYNWRIVMAPNNIIDYLVIHELAHLIQPNHSINFWKIVEKYCPHYQNCRNWLKVNGPILMRFLK